MSSSQKPQGRNNYQLILILLVLALMSIILVWIGVRSMGYRSPESPVKTQGETPSKDNQDDESSVIRFFESDVPRQEGVVSKPNAADKKVECSLNGVMVQEGTVASDTVCVNPP